MKFEVRGKPITHLHEGKELTRRKFFALGSAALGATALAGVVAQPVTAAASSDVVKNLLRFTENLPRTLSALAHRLGQVTLHDGSVWTLNVSGDPTNPELQGYNPQTGETETVLGIEDYAFNRHLRYDIVGMMETAENDGGIVRRVKNQWLGIPSPNRPYTAVPRMWQRVSVIGESAATTDLVRTPIDNGQSRLTFVSTKTLDDHRTRWTYLGLQDRDDYAVAPAIAAALTPTDTARAKANKKTLNHCLPLDLRDKLTSLGLDVESPDGQNIALTMTRKTYNDKFAEVSELSKQQIINQVDSMARRATAIQIKKWILEGKEKDARELLAWEMVRLRNTNQYLTQLNSILAMSDSESESGQANHKGARFLSKKQVLERIFSEDSFNLTKEEIDEIVSGKATHDLLQTAAREMGKLTSVTVLPWSEVPILQLGHPDWSKAYVDPRDPTRIHIVAIDRSTQNRPIALYMSVTRTADGYQVTELPAIVSHLSGRTFDEPISMDVSAGAKSNEVNFAVVERPSDGSTLVLRNVVFYRREPTADDRRTLFCSRDQVVKLKADHNISPAMTVQTHYANGVANIVTAQTEDNFPIVRAYAVDDGGRTMTPIMKKYMGRLVEMNIVPWETETGATQLLVVDRDVCDEYGKPTGQTIRELHNNDATLAKGPTLMPMIPNRA